MRVTSEAHDENRATSNWSPVSEAMTTVASPVPADPLRWDHEDLRFGLGLPDGERRSGRRGHLLASGSRLAASRRACITSAADDGSSGMVVTS